ncbi:MAG: methyltransferase, partial [Alphaproteobacteria bacterium]
LSNIRFVTGSLLDASDLGRFDYIDCCGVLHHLEDPDAGMRALVAALAEGGGIGFMVYGELGRSGVYPAQELLRLLAPAAVPAGERVATARRLVAALPETNLLRRNPLLGDHLASDAGIFDLLLHARDRAYRVPDVLALLARAGLRLVTFIEPLRYEPETWTSDPVLRRRLAGLPAADRAAAAELLASVHKVHIAYAVRDDHPGDTVARPTDDAIPALRDMEAAALARAIRPGAPLTVRFDGVPLPLALPALAGPIVARIDGRRTVAAIRDELRASVDPRLGEAAFADAFAATYRALNGINRLLIAGYG